MPTSAQIDAVLPQTQCGLCGFNGCQPYADALANNAAEINLCPPGGVSGLLALGELLQRDATPFITEMAAKAKPLQRAVIREAECIGCTKCIAACPVDAILGAGKQMHTVIAIECTGCELCIAPCPVDCIDLVPLLREESLLEKKKQADHFRMRYLARESRLAKQAANAKPVKIPPPSLKKDYIQEALARAKAKKK
jgi:electron transport complex protein RnfB